MRQEFAHAMKASLGNARAPADTNSSTCSTCCNPATVLFRFSLVRRFPIWRSSGLAVHSAHQPDCDERGADSLMVMHAAWRSISKELSALYSHQLDRQPGSAPTAKDQSDCRKVEPLHAQASAQRLVGPSSCTAFKGVMSTTCGFALPF